jgi:hypothetical protein
MANETRQALVPGGSRSPSGWLRFSLKTLLLLTALVPVYFRGRASTMLGGHEPPSGT